MSLTMRQVAAARLPPALSPATTSDVLNPYFSPILYGNHSGLPEAIIITAEHDPLRDQGEMYLSMIL